VTASPPTNDRELLADGASDMDKRCEVLISQVLRHVQVVQAHTPCGALQGARQAYLSWDKI
jgi:hypothetical protein